tara:strand:- start:23 stop:619 length:597 start_codon:yes stop_codon:yes gene_type:complete
MANIRLADPSRDARQVAAIYYPYVINTHITFEYVPPDGSVIASRMKSQQEKFPWLVCEHERELMGFAYGSPFRSQQAYDWSVETTIYVRESAHNLGIGSALYETLIKCLRLQGYMSAVGVIALPNEPSVSLHNKFGYKEIGILPNAGYKSGSWYDVAIWRLELEEASPTPEKIVSIDDITNTLDFAKILETESYKISI